MKLSQFRYIAGILCSIASHTAAGDISPILWGILSVGCFIGSAWASRNE